MPGEAARFERIGKRFPGVQALSDVSLSIAAGACHALCGENGAGKSTLGKILAGIYAPDEGRLFVNGTEARFSGPRDALMAGVGMVHQELAFCENLTVAENLCLSQLPTRRGMLSRSAMEARAQSMLEAIGLGRAGESSIDVRHRVGELTIAQQQMVQIAAAVGSGARIIVFDEPTSSLSQAEVQRLYELIDRLKAEGVTCIYVSHRMPELFRLCDAVTVLRDGRHVATRPMSGVTESELVRMMIGRHLTDYFPEHLHGEPSGELLRVEDLTVPGKVDGVSFSVQAGEIVGLAGLVGAGRSEVARAIFGLEPISRGSVYVNGKRVHIRNPRDAINLGIGLVPEDRKRQGLVLSESGVHNTSLPILPRLSRFTWMRRGEERQLAAEYFDKLRVRTPSIESVVAGLSGGNQQKVVLAKWLAAQSNILILDEPTRGVDVGAKAEIHALIDNLAAQGRGVILISSELPEVLQLSRRILTLRAGRIVGDVPRARATQEGLLRLMAGLPDEDAANQATPTGRA
jgi:ABC-type sugar transport system ATPase subunit